MKAAPFTLHRPTTIDEATALLADVAEEGGLVLAGGQSLMPMMALRVAYPPHLVDINAIDTLSRISVADDMLSIGATVRHAAFHRPLPETGVLGRLLSTVVRHIAHYPIRQRGTFCGSLAHADPASEWCLVAATLDATIVLKSASGTRF
ncbi:MAG: FAD binding domain-containing protein, partial [Rhizobiales bacterium]|nr:FAD binding domain-containing protein [Hyphomicrobiales bacterium]